MITITVAEARAILHELLDEVTQTHKPVLITGSRANAVLISEEDWRAIEETIYLLGVPNMHESIVEGLNMSLDECEDKVEW